MMQVLVHYMENEGDIGEYFDKYHERLNMGEMLRISVLDVRFENMDQNSDNIIILEEEDGTPHFTSIDHEISLPFFVRFGEK
ncbi:hypothetical protein EUTSA_v10000644mg [Eutrema salsugineum]|uniref:1-phosphatidylinositol 4-kinase n=1 Tax=Eutrema salsugineum TaxID=72664 RepID=V4LS31_EUTSA|nr:hypothetical protein EUTSA_v10000644mg [Eutrema salsugineum]